jgi:hypothetical protein
MTLRPEQIRARQYFEEKGTRLPVAEIRTRLAAAFRTLEDLLATVDEATARRRTIAGEWSVQEVVDHLVETHRPSIAELRDLLAGRRPPGQPIPAGLQSRAPMERRWADLLRDLAALHAESLAVLAGATDALPTVARAPIVMVVNVREADGREAPLHWIEELDWKAYAVVAFRLHVLDHLNQVRKTLAAGRSAA